MSQGWWDRAFEPNIEEGKETGWRKTAGVIRRPGRETGTGNQWGEQVNWRLESRGTQIRHRISLGARHGRLRKNSSGSGRRLGMWMSSGSWWGRWDLAEEVNLDWDDRLRNRSWNWVGKRHGTGVRNQWWRRHRIRTDHVTGNRSCWREWAKDSVYQIIFPCGTWNQTQDSWISSFLLHTFLPWEVVKGINNTWQILVLVANTKLEGTQKLWWKAVYKHLHKTEEIA